MASILLIEDDAEIRRLVAGALARSGHHIESAAVAMEGLNQVVRERPDLIILDLGLPDLDGRQLLKMIRTVTSAPVMVVTARGGESEVVGTLDAGADDYLVKPFSVAQLEARVRALLRRADNRSSREVLIAGELRVDLGAREASLDGRPLDLSPKEFDLLALLVERAGEVIGKKQMLAEVWRQPYGGSDRTVDVHLSWLRQKLGESASQPRYIHTVHGVGIKLVAPER
jgi:DNA-binding response OmpR family regulator